MKKGNKLHPKKPNAKILAVITAVIIVVVGGVLYGQYIVEKKNITPEEQAKIDIDEYNFGQLKKAKKILKKIPEKTTDIFSINEFNSRYGADIQPIKNCYIINTRNGDEDYIFAFMLESEKYIKKYGDKYYAYPKYGLPIDKRRTGFEYIISHPCEKWNYEKRDNN